MKNSKKARNNYSCQQVWIKGLIPLPAYPFKLKLRHAGGQKHDASETVGIHKIKPKSERINGISYEAHYVDIESTKLIPAENVNRIAVRHLFYELQEV